MQAEKKRGGRPTTKPIEGQKATLGIRASADLKTSLNESAKRNGRSLSQEAELRLEQSFRNEGLLEEALGMAYGRIDSDLLISVLGEIMRAATNVTHSRTGHQHWSDDPDTFAPVVKIVDELFSALKPISEPNEISSDLSEKMIRRSILNAANNNDWLSSRRERLGFRAHLTENWLKVQTERLREADNRPLDIEALTRHIKIHQDDDQRVTRGTGEPQ